MSLSTGQFNLLTQLLYFLTRITASNWLWNFGIGYASEYTPFKICATPCSLNKAPYLVNKAPGSAGLEAKVFFIWGSTCFCCIIFTYFCIPEVRISGLSLPSADRESFSRPRVCHSSKLISCTRTQPPSSRWNTADVSFPKAQFTPKRLS